MNPPYQLDATESTTDVRRPGLVMPPSYATWHSGPAGLQVSMAGSGKAAPAVAGLHAGAARSRRARAPGRFNGVLVSGYADLRLRQLFCPVAAFYHDVASPCASRREEMRENPGSETAAGRSRRLFTRGAAAILGVGLVAAAAQAQNDDRIAAGLATWRNSGCADCHGAFADGERQRDEMPAGANLRTTKLDAAALRQTISCGRPGTGMPSFDEGAYKVRPCNGQTPGAPPSDLFPAPTTLTPDQIDAVVAYLQAHVIGKGRTVTKQECLFYYADDPDFCEDYK